MKINNPETHIYLNRLISSPDELEKALISYADQYQVPIIDRVSMNFIQTLLEMYQPKEILEIGTAIGYSALMMHKKVPDSSITTLERDKVMYEVACKNISQANKAHSIQVIEGDALEILPLLIKDNKKYDFIFIDAAKGKYREFFEFALKLAHRETIFITDNVLFHGYVTGENSKSKRLAKLGKKINNYNEWLMKQSHLQTSIIPIGDGIALTVFKKI